MMKSVPLVAAVFLNRLRKGMKLQADPTTIYGITEGKFKFSRLLSKKDLSLQSPYNTYYILNLPTRPYSLPWNKVIAGSSKSCQKLSLIFCSKWYRWT